MKCRVRAVIEHEGKLFLVRHQGYDTWCLPGGGMDDGESIAAAMKRELLEELGIVAEVGSLLVVHQFERNEHYEGPEFFVRVSNPEAFQDIDLTQTSHGAAEIAEYGFFDRSTLGNLRPAFLQTMQFNDNHIEAVLE